MTPVCVTKEESISNDGIAIVLGSHVSKDSPINLSLKPIQAKNLLRLILKC